MRHRRHRQQPLPPLSRTGRRATWRAGPPVVLAALLLLAAGGAGAQTSGSVALSSDYRWRGESLSDGRAASQLAVNYDNAAGWYGGAQLASVRLRERDGAQAIAYAGLARRLASGWSWEAGASATVHSRDHASDYREGFVGLAGERLGVRLSLAPRYLGRDLRSAYLELNGFQPVHERLKLIAHLGLLHPLSQGAGPQQRDNFDLRLGIAATLGDASLQLAWLARTRNAPRPSYADPSYATSAYSAPAPAYAGDAAPDALVLSLSYSF